MTLLAGSVQPVLKCNKSGGWMVGLPGWLDLGSICPRTDGPPGSVCPRMDGLRLDGSTSLVVTLGRNAVSNTLDHNTININTLSNVLDRCQ